MSNFFIAYRRKCSCRQAQKKVEEVRKQAEEEQEDIGKFLHKVRLVLKCMLEHFWDLDWLIGFLITDMW